MTVNIRSHLFHGQGPTPRQTDATVGGAFARGTLDMPFRIPTSAQPKPQTPLELFYILPRSKDVPHPWGHQQDLFRSYTAAAASAKDVALELPTGAGKSLVGLVLAEFRRQVHGERVAYLCPTKQLAYQVHRQAAEYGVQAVVLIGQQRDYDPHDYGAFNTAQKVAITTYSAVFNVKPRIDNAECLILDDAHAAEGPVASHWSVEIDRKKNGVAYDALVDLFADVLPEGLLFSLTTDGPGSDPSSVGIVLQPELWSRADRVRAIISRHAAGADYRYAWSLVSEKLEACQLYVGRGSFLLRPLSPPTETHPPFARAKHRIYMSATLGNSGDLERTLGVGTIKRLPIPQGWDKHGTGRRLILFPNASLRPEEVDELAAAVGRTAGRLLVLTTDKYRVAKIKDTWLSDVGKPILSAENVEADIAAFTAAPSAVLLLTNRYDGIDLPGDSCRTMVIDDHPDATNLQERFLAQRLGASAFLRDRIRTRLTQAMGRCTRNAVDYATVIVLGDRLWKFLGEKDVRSAMHPELQVELAFGIENSSSLSVEGFIARMQEFRTPEWESAEKYLTTERQRISRRGDPIAEKLQAVVGDELAYVYASWNGEWDRALAKARAVADGLEGGSELRPYQALWLYLASAAAQRVAADDAVAEDLLRRAVSCAGGLAFFVRRASRKPSSQDEHWREGVAALAAMNVANELANLGGAGTRFQRETDAMLKALGGAEPKAFERGIETLGRLLGFNVLDRGKVEAKKAIPDAVWFIEHAVVFGWEAKSNDTGTGPIPIEDVRLARLHVDWIREQLKLEDDTSVTIVFTSPRPTLDPEAVKYAANLRHVVPADVHAFGELVVQTLAKIRNEATGASDEIVREVIVREFRRAHLLPYELPSRWPLLTALGTKPNGP